ncbi:MAG: copper oxidase [Gammaproteobacteria bacterium]|nr:MAG: copper oxidase [Gammaproteobacteria bacterium]
MKLFQSKWFSAVLLLGCFYSVEGSAAVREYWVAAEKVQWDYAPSGVNLMKEKAGLGPWGETRVYSKYRYIQYQDASFTSVVPQPEWMGILGPQLKAEVGDVLKVHFLNKADKPLSMHPHGVKYDEDNDGADLRGKGGVIKPGETYTYTWEVDEGAGPGPKDGSSIVWLYHSHVNAVQEIYDGLIGTIVVTQKGMAKSAQDPSPKDVDHEFTTMFMVFNEEDGEEGGLMHTMNGYVFGNLQGYEADEGDTVRWHLVGMGSEVDLHTAHWHGETVLNAGRRTDVVNLLPATMTTVTMLADNPGEWLYHCHVADHVVAGMSTRWKVNPK